MRKSAEWLEKQASDMEKTSGAALKAAADVAVVFHVAGLYRIAAELRRLNDKLEKKSALEEALSILYNPSLKEQTK